MRNDSRANREIAWHSPKVGESYRLGIFLVGAYQETLGDIHNLFGDTDTVDVRVDGAGFALSNARRGDSCDRVLGYVGFDAEDLRAAFKAKVDRANVDAAFAARIAADLEAGLTAYTYLEETPHA